MISAVISGQHDRGIRMSKVFVLGGAQTDFERNWTKEGKNVLALLREGIQDGLDAAGLSFEEIQRLNEKNRVAAYVGNFCAEKYISQGHLGALLTEAHPAFDGVPSARYEAACASSSVALDAAITKIASDEYDVCVVVGFELMKTVDSSVGGDYLGFAAYYEDEARGVPFPFPKLFGKLADELLKKYDYNERRFMDALGIIAVQNYDNAKRNPKAQTRGWFMSLEQAQARDTDTNPLVGGRLASSDCSQVTDGCVVVVLASEHFLQEKGIVSKPVVKGWGHRVAPMRFGRKMEDVHSSGYILPWTRQAVCDAYRRSGLTVDDIDVFETHDCFTSSEFAAISAFGLTEPGDELDSIEAGRFAFGGEKPINPSGGLIGCGHPVGASGARMFLDLYKQVSGEAGGYQVEDARNALMLNIGGSATTNYVFIVGSE